MTGCLVVGIHADRLHACCVEAATRRSHRSARVKVSFLPIPLAAWVFEVKKICVGELARIFAHDSSTIPRWGVRIRLVRRDLLSGHRSETEVEELRRRLGFANEDPDPAYSGRLAGTRRRHVGQEPRC